MTQNYITLRPYLLAVAYNMTGQVHEAEDLVQDAFVDLLKQPVAEVRNLKSYLTRIVINKSIDRATQLKKEREAYPGMWLPEPFLTENESDVNADILPYAFMHLLENLNPVERAIVILREAFSYSYEEVAEVCNVSVENCRQILHRTKSKLKQHVRVDTKASGHDGKIMKAFLQACLDQNTEKLSSLLKSDVQLYSDGGGKATAARNILDGISGVVRFILGVVRKTFPLWSAAKPVFVNGQPAWIMENGHDGVYLVLILAIQDGTVSTVYTMRNPDKIFYKNLSQKPLSPDLDAK